MAGTGTRASTHVTLPARLEVLAGAAQLAAQQDDHQRAKILGKELLTLACSTRDRASEANARFVLSRAANQRGANAEALAFAAEAVALYRTLEDDEWLPWVLQRLAIEEYIAGNLDQASAHFAEELERFRTMRNPLGIAYALTNFGLARHAMGDERQAAALYRETLALRSTLQDPWETANVLDLVAALATETGAAEAAAQLLGAAAALLMPSRNRCTALHPQAPRPSRGDRAGPSREAMRRGRLGGGHALSFVQAIEAAKETVAAIEAALASPNAPSAAVKAGLSRRELEVLRLVAEGHSDRQIAEALSISPKTAGNHVSSILAKLGVSDADRRAAAAELTSGSTRLRQPGGRPHREASLSPPAMTTAEMKGSPDALRT